MILLKVGMNFCKILYQILKKTKKLNRSLQSIVRDPNAIKEKILTYM